LRQRPSCGSTRGRWGEGKARRRVDGPQRVVLEPVKRRLLQRAGRIHLEHLHLAEVAAAVAGCSHQPDARRLRGGRLRIQQRRLLLARDGGDGQRVARGERGLHVPGQVRAGAEAGGHEPVGAAELALLLAAWKQLRRVAQEREGRRGAAGRPVDSHRVVRQRVLVAHHDRDAGNEGRGIAESYMEREAAKQQPTCRQPHHLLLSLYPPTS